MYLISGSSENITLMAGICLGVLYGGKTAIGVNPIGTRVKAVARIEGFAAPAPTAEGVAPPPPDPGEELPKETGVLNKHVHQCQIHNPDCYLMRGSSDRITNLKL